MEEMGKVDSTPPLKIKIQEIDPKQVVLLKQNARYMSATMFSRLVENIRRDGCLSSTPLCCIEAGKLLCLSGNHRTKAAIAAGLETIRVMVIQTDLTADQRKAIQLSHNAINGADDFEKLKQIWQEINAVDAKLYSGLSKESIENLEFPKVPPIDARLDYEQLTLLFLGDELETLRSIAVECRRRGVLSDNNWVETIDNYEQVTKVLTEVCTREKVINMATAILAMADYAERYIALCDKKDG